MRKGNRMNKSKLLKELKAFKQLHGMKYGIISLGLFGSFVRNEASEYSDVDIVVTTQTPDLFNLVHIKGDLEKSGLQKEDFLIGN